jgi:transposase
MNAEAIQNVPQSVRTYIHQLENRIIKYKNENLEYRNKNLYLQEQLNLLLYKRFGRAAEQLRADDTQMPLFTEEAKAAGAEAAEDKEEMQVIKSYTRKKPGRKPLDPSLPREDTIIDIEEGEKTCACGAKLVKIGEETNEKLHIIPQRVYVERIIRYKYACRECEGIEDEERPTVRIAPAPPSIIPRSIASADLLSCIIIQKFEDHLPYYRQEKQFERIGVVLSRQDMANWQRQVYEKLLPLFSLLKEWIKSGPVMQMDETTVQVMGEEGRKDTQKSYMWLARGGPPGKPAVLYEYHPTRGSMHIKDFIEGFSGYLQTDGYEGYDAALRGRTDIKHAGCFAHARRKFFEATKGVKNPQSAEEGIKYIRKLYALEDELRSQELAPQEFLSARKEGAGPILEKFRAWLIKRSPDTPGSLLLGKAIRYTLDQWDKLTAYLESPYLTPDNNACENAIRPFVLGRKNWLFCKSPEGADSSCGMYSLIQTSRQNGIVPAQYLTALFERAPLARTPEDWKKLLPWNIFTA